MIGICFSLVDGGWTDWTNSGECSTTCGLGIQFMTRKCSKPKPLYGGKECEGEKEKEVECKNDPCPGKCKLISLSTMICFVRHHMGGGGEVADDNLRNNSTMFMKRGTIIPESTVSNF